MPRIPYRLLKHRDTSIVFLQNEPISILDCIDDWLPVLSSVARSSQRSAPPGWSLPTLGARAAPFLRPSRTRGGGAPRRRSVRKRPHRGVPWGGTP